MLCKCQVGIPFEGEPDVVVQCRSGVILIYGL